MTALQSHIQTLVQENEQQWKRYDDKIANLRAW